MIMSDQLIDEKNFYYSSDEDVSWGPLTLREIRREFAIPIKKPLFLKKASPLDREKYQDLQTSRSINSSNTDYCTANETVESNIKSDQINDEMETKSSSLNSKEIANFSKKLSLPNQISEEKERPDADAVIYVYSDESNEDFEHFRVKTEVTNSSNIDIISLSSDDEGDYTNEKFYETDVGIENIFEKNNKVPNTNISVNGKSSSSISFSNKTTDSAFETNCSINQYSSGSSTPDDSKYRISKNRSSANKNKNIEQANISAHDSLREQHVKYGKSLSCISSSNENIESTEFNNYENVILANSTSNIERNEWDEVMSSTFSEEKSSNCAINQYSSGSSTPDDLMKKQGIKYKISKNKSSANKNKNIEQANISANDSLKERVKYWKSQSCISSPNENIESTEFDNYETAINANSTSNVERNERDEVMSLSTFYEKKSFPLNNSGNIKHSSFEHDSSTHECEIYKNNSIESLITSESIEENSLEREKSTSFAVGETEIDYNNHIHKRSNDENSRVFSNISSSGVDDKHKYKLNTSDDCADLNSEYSRSKLNYIEDSSFLDDTLSQVEKLMNETATDEIKETNLKFPVEENKILSHIEEPISRIPIFLSAPNENKYTSMPSVSDFKMPNPRNAKKFLNVDKKLTPIKKSPNVFKNIVSPVRIYIKNSSMPVLKQTHKPIMVKHTSSSIQETSTSQPIKHRNLVKSLPEVIYKPSKKVIEKYDKEIILPDNIRKLVKERIVIKHEIRTKVDLNESELTTCEKLQRADISHVISDERNMSLRTAKQRFNI
ncbi:hypothetical protein WA026_012566 [Henosepilachna vigintioctopunctata]|uniref:Uncharacterized protein n=1 Tax=Henosepilachna vigintioctopunctata TaxID=420089 RepID=A0AAW1TXF2_9CUCU